VRNNLPPLKREVARSAGGVTHQRANNVRPYKAVSQYIIIRPIHIP
jgi:hypothetical protein